MESADVSRRLDDLDAVIRDVKKDIDRFKGLFRLHGMEPSNGFPRDIKSRRVKALCPVLQRLAGDMFGVLQKFDPANGRPPERLHLSIDGSRMWIYLLEAPNYSMNIEIYGDIEVSEMMSFSIWNANAWNTMGMVKVTTVGMDQSAESIAGMGRWKNCAMLAVKHYLICKSMCEKFAYVSSNIVEKSTLDLILKCKSGLNYYRFIFDLSSWDHFVRILFVGSPRDEESKATYDPRVFTVFTDFQLFLSTFPSP